MILLVIPLVPGEDLLFFPTQCTGGIQQRSWEQKHSSAATSSLNSFKNWVSPNYMLTATVPVTSQILFCLLCQMQMKWHASMRGDETGEHCWGRRGEHAHLCTTWECRCLAKQRGAERVEKSRSVIKQYLFPRGGGVQEECRQGLLAPPSLRDQKSAFYTHIDLQGLAEVLTL